MTGTFNPQEVKMSRTVLETWRDTIQPQNMTIDSTFSGVFAYANGSYAWPLDQIMRYRHAGKTIAFIDVTGAIPHIAPVLDVERFDATPDEAAVWVRQRNQLHGDATVYCNKDTLPAVVDACRGQKFWLFTADPTGTPHIANLGEIPGIKQAVVQWEFGQLWDTSAVYDPNWLAAMRRRS